MTASDDSVTNSRDLCAGERTRMELHQSPNGTEPLIQSEARAALRAAVEPFERPSAACAVWQLSTSAGLYVATLALMYWSLRFSYWLTLIFALPAAGFLARTFIVQHDCGHGSYFGSKRANDILGSALGVLTRAPYGNWRRQHAQHHNLDRREHGVDTYTARLTVEEHRSRSPFRHLLYRLPRHAGAAPEDYAGLDRILHR
jgi:omega-6 fatty acid desaturase (delta-12 desaturase)